MTDTSSTLAGTLEPWPKKEVLGELLQSHGLEIYIGRYSVQIRGNSPTHFSFEQYGENTSDPVIEADSDSPENMEKLAQIVSTIYILVRSLRPPIL